ncbi:DUF4013 domain-containing protein [Blastopirellula marina]|uniref:DUF4013 domain-containing protein n=1 Tax=Blastopirellula marina TaxID=124 RepID=A0A2S8FPY9_9BACT|nr:DUF4013 domain-containing protein [Blastopirellula marina]PQO33914.1 hypothetical protein C5Y98_16975 [Blastopirellula marina]PTL43701.1 DUF4013 domain-containing protein [Blastopirellula marina]
MSGDNPFASSGEDYNAPNNRGDGTVQARSSMDYLEAFGKVFENSNWFINALVVGLVNYIPIIGAIVVIGFSVTIVHEKSIGRTNSYPDFDLNKFGEYLIRGFWMFLTGLLFGLCLAPLAVILAIVPMGLQASGSDTLAVFGTLFLFVVLLIASMLANLAALPLILRAGLTCSFSEAFDFAWVKDFVSKMWLDQILGMIILSIISWFVLLVGFVALCVGIIPAIGVVTIAYWNYITQLYQVYIGRGGQPISYRDSGSL